MSQIETGNVGRSARGKQVRHSACQTDWGKWKCSALRRSRRGGMESSAFRPWTWSDRANRWREGRKGGVCSKSQDGWRDVDCGIAPQVHCILSGYWTPHFIARAGLPNGRASGFLL